MAGKKVQVPVVGGLRKVIHIPTQVSAGTTIQEFGSAVVTLAQLKAALGITAQRGTQTGSSGAASIVVGPGLSGGGVLVGPVPIGLTAPIPWFPGEDGGDGDVGPPGMPGANGLTGAQGPTGPAVFFLPEDPEEALNAIPGSVGPQGLTGAAGPVGPAVFLDAEPGEEGQVGPPGAAGPAGATGPTGASAPIIWLPGDDGEDGQIGPPGATGATGAGASTNITPDTHPTSPTAWDDEFEFGSTIDTTGGRFGGANAWTLVTPAGTSMATTQSQGALQTMVQTGASAAGGGYQQAVPGGSWTFVWRSRLPVFIVYNSSTWKNYYFGWSGSGNSIVLQSETRNWSTGSFSFNSSISSLTTNGLLYYFMLAYNGTNLVFSSSTTGLTSDFAQLSSVAASAWIITPTNVGLGNGGIGVDWFRRTA